VVTNVGSTPEPLHSIEIFIAEVVKELHANESDVIAQRCSERLQSAVGQDGVCPTSVLRSALAGHEFYSTQTLDDPADPAPGQKALCGEVLDAHPMIVGPGQAKEDLELRVRDSMLIQQVSLDLAHQAPMHPEQAAPGPLLKRGEIIGRAARVGHRIAC